MSFYSQTQTSHKAFENGELVDSTNEITVNDNNNIINIIQNDDSGYKPKIGVDGLTKLILQKTSKVDLPTKLSLLNDELDQMIMNPGKVRCNPKSKTFKKRELLKSSRAEEGSTRKRKRKRKGKSEKKKEKKKGKSEKKKKTEVNNF